MKNYQLIEDYFVKLHQNYGISELSYKDKRLEIDEHNIKNLVFLSEDFNDEFDNMFAPFVTTHVNVIVSDKSLFLNILPLSVSIVIT